MKKKKKKQPIKLLSWTSILIIIIIALITATLAWFVVSYTNQVNEFEMKTRIFGDFKVAAGIITDVNSDKFNYNATFDDHPDYNEKEISSNGEVFFSWRTTKNEGSNKPTSFVEAVANTDYIAQDFTFKADKNIDVYLTSDSSISDVNEGKNLSRAARVAFYEYVNGFPELRFVWAPNTTQDYDKLTSVVNIDGTEGTYTAVKDGLPPVTDETVLPETPGKVASFVTNNEITLKTIQVRVWLEGTDPATIDQNMDNNFGKWNLDLVFMSVNK